MYKTRFYRNADAADVAVTLFHEWGFAAGSVATKVSTIDGDDDPVVEYEVWVSDAAAPYRPPDPEPHEDDFGWSRRWDADTDG